MAGRCPAKQSSKTGGRSELMLKSLLQVKPVRSNWKHA